MSDTFWDPTPEVPLWLRQHCFWSEHEDLKQRLSEVQQGIIVSCLARHDEKTAVKHLNDWMRRPYKTVYISKYVPGSHFYVLGTKFDTVSEARRHAENQGYRVGDEIQTVRTPYDGD
jgi:hypothetical protein